MADQLSPGTKVTRQPASSPVITGVATGTGGFIGTANMGPINSPQIVSGETQFAAMFGGPMLGSALYGAVAGFFNNGGARCLVSRVAHYTDITSAASLTALKATASLPSTSSGASTLSVTAANEGAWANSIGISTSREDTLMTLSTAAMTAGAHTSLALASTAQLAPGDLIRITDGVALPILVTITSINGKVISFASITVPSGGVSSGAKIYLLTFTLWAVDSNGATFPNSRQSGLRVSPLSLQDYMVSRYNSALSPIVIANLSPSVADPRPDIAVALPLSGGDNGGAVVDADIIGNAGAFLGLHAFDKTNEGSLLSAPGWNSGAVQGAGSSYCDSRDDMNWVGGAPTGLTPAGVNTFKSVTALMSSEQSALYWPQIQINDPLSGQVVNFPAEGHIQGAYARTDSKRSVGKVAAGEIDGLLVGAVGVEYDIAPAEYDLIYPNQVNAIQLIPGKGVCIFGSRNTYPSGDYPQVNQSRTVTYVQKSLKKGSGWVNFENSDQSTWNRIIRSFSSFLSGARKVGILKGLKDSDAFYVICDASNNPENQQRAGLLKVRVGIAVNNPAEFLEIDIELKTATSASGN